MPGGEPGSIFIEPNLRREIAAIPTDGEQSDKSNEMVDNDEIEQSKPKIVWFIDFSARGLEVYFESSASYLNDRLGFDVNVKVIKNLATLKNKVASGEKPDLIIRGYMKPPSSRFEDERFAEEKRKLYQSNHEELLNALIASKKAEKQSVMQEIENIINTLARDGANVVKDQNSTLSQYEDLFRKKLTPAEQPATISEEKFVPANTSDPRIEAPKAAA